jgi:hypothetical protein
MQPFNPLVESLKRSDHQTLMLHLQFDLNPFLHVIDTWYNDEQIHAPIDITLINNDYRCYLTIITYFVIEHKTDEIFRYYLSLLDGDKRIKERHINFVSRLYNILQQQKYTRFTEGFRGLVIQCLEKIIRDVGLLKKDKKKRGLQRENNKSSLSLTGNINLLYTGYNDDKDEDDSDMHISYSRNR